MGILNLTISKYFGRPDYLYDSNLRQILKNASEGRVATNYDEAVDGDISTIRSELTRGVDKIKTSDWGLFNFLPLKAAIDHLPTGLSNCTLTATQWVNPKAPIKSAKTIVNRGQNFGYYEVPKEYAAPADLLISSTPDDSSFHTMFIEKYDREGNPVLTYSSGLGDLSSLRRSIKLADYLNRSEGKTKLRYYKYLPDKGHYGFIPEITVKPTGNYYNEDDSIKFYNVE